MVSVIAVSLLSMHFCAPLIHLIFQKQDSGLFVVA